MRRAGHIRAGWSRIASLLMLLVMLARAPLPIGFMPVLDRDSGSITVAMCSGHGATQTINFKQEAPEQHRKSSRDCPFATLVGHAAPLPLSPLLVKPALWESGSALLSSTHAAPFASVHRPGAPPRGPPAQA